MTNRAVLGVHAGCTVIRYDSPAAALAAGERDVAGATPPHRLDWATGTPGRAWWLAVREPSGESLGGFKVAVQFPRALPGHRRLHLRRLRVAGNERACAATVMALASTARADWRVLAVGIDAFFADAAERETVERMLKTSGFAPAKNDCTYTHTVRIDLAPDPDTVFAGLHATARRHIRAPAKHALVVQSVNNPAMAPRLEALLGESFARTGGEAPRENWEHLIRYTARQPEQARLVGLHRPDRAGPDALVAFALGLHHGDHAEYATAGAMRTDDLKVPLAYGLAWDLMLWARAQGTTWFDFGGYARAEEGPRAGINRFKLKFGTDVVEVGGKWVLLPRPLRDAWVKGAGMVTGTLRNLAESRRHSETATSHERNDVGT